MPPTYEQIKEEYSNYYSSLLRQGKLPLRDTGIGFWGAAVSDEIIELFRRIEIHKYRSFIDLGSGDGKVVLMAALFCRKAVGIEADKELVDVSLDMRDKFLLHNADFHHKDFMQHDISDYDLVFINPDKPLHRNGVEKKLLKELNGTLVHYGHHFQPTQLARKQSFVLNDTPVGIYSRQTP